MGKEPEYTTVPIDDIEPNDWNPNIEDPVTFNELVENIKEYGFKDPLEVVRLGGSDRFRIIDGEHRWKAAKLAGEKELPVVIVDFEEDIQKVQTVKASVIRGRMDPARFTKLYLDMEKKYGPEKLRKLMGLSQKDAEFRRLLRQVKKGLPEEVQVEIEKRADKIRNVEDLAAIVNSLYAKYGGTLQSHYMMFSYGGQTHIMIKLNETGWKATKGLMERCRSNGVDINDEVARRFNDGPSDSGDGAEDVASKTV